MQHPETAAIFAVSPKGVALARLIAAGIKSDLFILSRYCDGGGNRFDSLSDKVAEVFPLYRNLIFVMAQGIVSRVIAPHLESKYTDPAVVVCDEAGRFAVSAASGHEGGANALACLVAGLTGATPVITTATQADRLYVAGIGTRKGVSADAVVNALGKACAEAGIAVSDIRLIASAWLKKDERGIGEAAARLGILTRFLPEFLFQNTGYPLAKTKASQYFDIPAVAEPSALIAGHNPVLVLPGQSFDGVMVAITKDCVLLSQPLC